MRGDVLPTADGLDNVRRAIDLTAGKHAISIQLSPDTSNAPAQIRIRLNRMTPEQRIQTHAEAIEAARSAHTVVLFLWTRGKPAFASHVTKMGSLTKLRP